MLYVSAILMTLAFGGDAGSEPASHKTQSELILKVGEKVHLNTLYCAIPSAAHAVFLGYKESREKGKEMAEELSPLCAVGTVPSYIVDVIDKIEREGELTITLVAVRDVNGQMHFMFTTSPVEEAGEPS